ncbi:hypothetical protein BC826DRAFT_1021878 [Russula brevipes]|nr:hypothetical protein BC826DRAFT_1021878 [Russula brevipes]
MTSRRSDDDETSTLGDPSAPTSLTMSTDRFTSKRSGPTLGTPLIILSALVLPSALIPLLVLRRSVNSLHRKIDELSGATRGLHHEFKSVMLELSVRKEQHEQLRVMIAEMRDGHARLRRKTQRMRTAGASADEHTRAQLQELAASNRYARLWYLTLPGRFDAHTVRRRMQSPDLASARVGDVEEAGPLSHMNYASLEAPLASHHSPPQVPGTEENSEQSGEQPLDSHELMELQAFSERKEWIMDKIKLLEGMPPVELFADLDAVRASTAAVSGLPTRERLQQWLIEHDKIEKETEIFDSGELKKFKNFTMAASKRNLSPQDTDIIELTLTTIYEFDKLLLLLRDRSENLDLLGVRLTWEEQRCAAWTDRRQLLADLQAFLSQRARWSASIYDTLPQVDSTAPTSTPTLTRRGSATSLASETSSSFPSGFSRGARFKHAEALSREAAQFAGRISSLRHGKITAAGKALDKLIENSRKPVPDELLDEQDRLEEKGISEMENVGRFIMSVVTQWRRADEFYVETMKDQTSAQGLLEDIGAAQLAHPSSRHDSIFSARTSSVIRRLSCRENPSSVSGFLRPTHALFPDQPNVNDSITKILREELEVGLSLARRLERGTLEYHAACEAVRKAEHSVVSANELSNAYGSFLHNILNGVESSDGDGSPPDLTSESCLRETKHAAFLALLPSLLQLSDKSGEEARSVLPTAQASLLGLADINVEPDFKERLVSAVQRLEVVKAESERARAMMTERVGLLRDARKIWVSASSILTDLCAIGGDMSDLMEQQKWKPNTTNHLPPTPESFNASLPLPNRTPETATGQVVLLRQRFVRDVQETISALPRSVVPSLHIYLAKRRDGLLAVLEHTQRTIRLADNINKQALAMTAILRLEDTKTRFDVLAEQILDPSWSGDALDNSRRDLVSDATSIQAACQTFMVGLPHHVIFVSSETSSTGPYNPANPSPQRRFSASLDLTLEALESLPLLAPPIDLAHLDIVSSLEQRIANLDVVLAARAVDLKLAALSGFIVLAEERHEAHRKTVFAVPDIIGSIDRLACAAAEASPIFDAHRSEISGSFPPIRQLLHEMDTMCSKTPASRHLDNTKAFLSDIRRREERLRAAQREQIKRERLEAEAAEKLRKEKAESEAKLKAEEERAKEERERVQAEAAELLRREQVEHETRMRVERERTVEATREHTQKGIDLPRVTCTIDSSELPSADLAEVQSHVAALRRRLQSLGINDAARPSRSSVSPLRTVGQHVTGVADSTADIVIDVEVKSLQDELDASHQLLPHALHLARFGSLVQDCDNALSDLLEHIDSYPAPPSGPLVASFVSSNMLPPEEQLNSRLAFTKSVIDKLENNFANVADEPKVSSERQRIDQTWTELESMSLDRINGRRSRPPWPSSPFDLKQESSPRADPIPNRSSSRLSVVSTNRSVSGPMASSSRLFSSTFSSRQRTISLSSTVSSPKSSKPDSSRRPLEPSHPLPPLPSHTRRAVSPTPSNASVISRSGTGARRPSYPAWGRPPPLPTHKFPPSKPPVPARKPYVANPKSKLDVAVGDVVNKLPENVDINVEIAQDTWQDRSGKYWIGGEDSRLCFCRILRSQTVMVRVGGGWMELSKFIQTHFADMFRLLPEPMPYLGSKEDKWISSSTLLEAPELITPPPRAPKTPDPGSGSMLLPSFALSSPSGKSPQSIKTHSSPGSPLTALQFLRRVDGEDSFLRPATPHKGSTLRDHARPSLPLPPIRSPNRAPAWKP